jgi:hypothetical protein
LPRLSVIHDDYSSHGFVALAVNLSEDMETIIKPWARQYHNPYLRDDGSVWPVYTHNNAIPTNYVIDPNGVIRYWEEGFDETTIRQVIQQYLPDPIDHDVGATRILAPLTAIDSGLSVTPACSVRNFGQFTETYSVRMRIGTQYDTTAVITSHAPGTTRYLEFPLFTARERGQIAVSCSTELAGDDIANNSFLTTSLVVNVYDIAVTAILVPPDTVDPGIAVTPAVIVHNRGTMNDMARVRLTIGDVYRESTNLALTVGRIDTAFLPQWIPAGPAEFEVRCSVGTFRADMLPDNNLLLRTVVVRPTGILDRPSFTPHSSLFTVSPNPARSSAAVRVLTGPLDPLNPGTLSVFSSSGSLLRSYPSPSFGTGVWELDIAGLSAGTYFFRLGSGPDAVQRKLVVTD